MGCSPKEDVEAALGIRIKLTNDADKYRVGRIISKVLSEISWREFESSGRYPAVWS